MGNDRAPLVVAEAHAPDWRQWAQGALSAMPIVMGYVPVAFTYGLLAREAGISPLNIILMSLLVYAGASQFIAVSLIAAGAAPLSVVATTFVVNLRHSFLAFALAPHVSTWHRREQAFFAYELTDETFAVHSAAFANGDLRKQAKLGLNLAAQISWLLGSCLGILAGRHLDDLRVMGLDYALPALFAALLVLQLKRWPQLAVALFSGAVALRISHLGLQPWSVIAAAILGSALGAILERWIHSLRS